MDTDPEAERAARLLEAGLSDASESTPPRTPPTAAEIAASFPDLEILDLLGQGGMGVVYRARQKRLDRVIALKILPRELGDDPAFAERFEREARTLAKLDHPHIVRIHEFGETDGLYFLVMEYVDGANLRQVMDAGTPNAIEALAIIPQVCEALQYAHDQGIVHRDVKPENILLDQRGRVKIADFGLAKLTEGERSDPTLTGTRQVMGTWQYMAPEQYRTPQQVDHRADIFSLGVVFYEMLTGDLPVGKYQQPSETVDLDRRIDGIVMRALEREREQRYQHAAEVRDDVELLEQTPEPERAGPEAPADVRPARGHRRGRGPLILAALAVLAGLLFSLFTYWFVKAVLDQTHEDATWAMAAVGCPIWALGGLLALLGGRHAARLRAMAHPWIVAGVLAFFNVFGIVLMLAHASNETYQWNRWSRGHAAPMGDFAPAPMGDFAPPPGSSSSVEFGSHPTPLNGPLPGSSIHVPRVLGAANVRTRSEVQRGVIRTFDHWVSLARDGDLDVTAAAPLYGTEDAERLNAMSTAFAATRGPTGKLGLGPIAAKTLGAAPHHFRITEIDLGPYERTAKVKASKRMPPYDRTITFGVRREEGEWKFVIAEVLVEAKRR